MSNLIERYAPWDPVYGDDLNHIIDILDGMRYNLLNVATGASGARYVIDTVSMRSYDNTTNLYGAPSGAGVTFEVSPNGNVFLGGGNLTLKSAGTAFIEFNSSTIVMRVNDGTRDRWAAGNLSSYTDPKGAVSPAGYTMRLVDASGNLLADATQTMIYFPVYTGYTPVDATNPATARFEITSDVVKVLKVTVSFYCDTFKVGQQSTATGTSITSAGGSSHAHTVTIGNHTHTTPDHSHLLFNFNGAAGGFSMQNYSGNIAIDLATGAQTGNIYTYSASGASTSGAGGGTTPTSSADTSHTHGVTIPSLSLTNPASLYNSGGASGVHVKVYNQAGTLLADHGPYTGGAGVFTSDIDITADSTWAAGWYQIQFTSAGIGGIEGQINIKATVQAG